MMPQKADFFISGRNVDHVSLVVELKLPPWNVRDTKQPSEHS